MEQDGGGVEEVKLKGETREKSQSRSEVRVRRCKEGSHSRVNMVSALFVRMLFVEIEAGRERTKACSSYMYTGRSLDDDLAVAADAQRSQRLYPYAPYPSGTRVRDPITIQPCLQVCPVPGQKRRCRRAARWRQAHPGCPAAPASWPPRLHMRAQLWFLTSLFLVLRAFAGSGLRGLRFMDYRTVVLRSCRSLLPPTARPRAYITRLNLSCL